MANISDVLDIAQRVSNWGRWGSDDQFGTVNFINADVIRQAAREVVSGKVFSLAIPLGANGPQHGTGARFNPIHVMLRDGGDALSGSFKQFYSGKDKHIRTCDDIVIMPLQCGTQWDALAHVIHNDSIYNGYSCSEVSSFGAEKNSISLMKDRLVGRGVLLDVARSEGTRWLEGGFGIGPEELENACDREGVLPEKGDIILIRTGQIGAVKETGNWGHYAGGPAPGLSLASMEWIADRNVAAVATDTWGFEVIPHETEDVILPLHIIAIVYMGLTVGEIFDLEALSEDCASDGRYRFLFSAAPLPITGAVGSPINPIAIK